MTQADNAAAAPQAATEEREEYNSVTVSLDHLVNRNRETNDAIVVKSVFSTETAHESVMAQIAYFRQTEILSDPDVFAVLASVLDHSAVIVYNVSPELTNVIVDADLMDVLIQRPEFGNGTVLGAHASLITLANDLLKQAKAEGHQTKILAFLPDAAQLLAGD